MTTTVTFLQRLLFAGIYVLLSKALRDNWEDALIPDYNEFYYYNNLEEKMAEVMSINNCTTSGHTLTGFESEQGRDADISIEIVKPPSSVLRKWGVEGNELHMIHQLYLKTTANLCSSKPYISYKKGVFKLSKGCLDMYHNDKVTGERVKAVKRYGATFHPYHIRCGTKDSSKVCVAASKYPEQVPLKFRSLNAYPFLIEAKNLVVARSGTLITDRCVCI